MAEEPLPWRFIEAGSVTVCQPFAEDSPPEAQYLALSNRYGFTIFYTAQSNIVFMKTRQLFELAGAKANLLEGGSADAVNVPIKGFVRSLHLSCDEQVLGIAKRRSILFFSAKSLEQKNTTSMGKVRVCATNDEEVRQVAWHPVIPNLLLVLSSKGKITLIDSATKQKYDWSTALEAEGVTSINWSISGKSVLCGCKSGGIIWATKDGAIHHKLPRPSDAFPDDQAEAHQVMNISARTIGAAYRLIDNGEPTGDSLFYTIELPTGKDKIQFTQFDRIGMPDPNRPNHYYIARVPDWNLLIIGGSNFPDVEVLGSSNGSYEQLNLEDSWRAQVPLREDGDNHLVGMTLDLTKADPTPDPSNPDRTPFPPAPVLFMLVDGGQILAYVFVKNDLPKDENLRLPFMLQPASIPAAQTIPSFAEKADSVPSIVLSAASPAPQTPASPSTGRVSLRQASTGLAATKPTPASTPSAPAQPQPQPQPQLFTPSATTPTFTFSAGTQFSFSPATSGAKMPEVAKLDLAAPGTGFTSPFTLGTSAQTPGATSIPITKPTPKPAATSTAPASSPSLGSPAVARNAGSAPFFSLPTPTQSVPPKVKAKEESRVATSGSAAPPPSGVSFTMPSLTPEPKPVAPVSAPTSKPVPVSITPTTTPAPASSPTPASAPKPREPVPRRPVVGDGGDARDLQNQFIEQINSFEQVLEEVRQTERETAKLMERIKNGPRSPDGKEFTLAGLTHLRDAADRLIDDVNSISEQNIQQQQSQKQVHEQYYEAMGRYTDADSLLAAKSDKQYQMLLNNRKLDPQSVEMRKNIQKLATDVETKIGEVENHLQRMWNAQRQKDKKSTRVPVGDTLYRTLKSYEEIARVQAVQLQEMTEQFEKIKLQSEYSSTLSLGLGFSSSRATSPAKRTQSPRREQRRRLSVVDRDRNGEEDSSAPRRVLRESIGELSGTPNGKVYNERMKELKKIVSQRVRNTRRRPFGSPAEGKQQTPDKRLNEQATEVAKPPVSATPATPPPNRSSEAAVRSAKPAVPFFSSSEHTSFPSLSSQVSGTTTSPITAAAATPASSFSWAAPASSQPPKLQSSLSFAASTPGEIGKAGTKPASTDTAAASLGFGGSFALPSFNIPETKPLSASAASSPPQKVVPVNLAEAYSRSDDESEEEGEYEEDGEGSEENEEEEEEAQQAIEAQQAPTTTAPPQDNNLFKPSTQEGGLFDFKPLSNPLTAVGDGSGVRPPGEFSFGPSTISIGGTASTEKKPTSTTINDVKPAALGTKPPVAKALFGSDDSAPLSFSFSTPAPASSAAVTSSVAPVASSTESSAPKTFFSPSTTASSVTSSLPSFDLGSTSTLAKPATSTASSSPASGASLASFSFTSTSADKPTSTLTPATTTSSSASPFGSFSFSGGATASGTPASSSPFGNLSTGLAPAASAPTAAAATPAASTGASPFGSFSFASSSSGTSTSSFGSTTTAPSGTGSGFFGGLSLGDPAKPASSPAANPFGAALSTGASTAPAASGSTGGLFGTTSSAPASSPFSSFGATSAGSSATPSMSLFGATTSLPTLASSGSNPTFGSTSFGAPAASPVAASSAPTFGAQTPLGGSASTPAFGQPAFGAPSPLGGGGGFGGGFGTTAFGNVSGFSPTPPTSTPTTAPAAAGRTFGSGFPSSGGFGAAASSGGGFASLAGGGGGGFASLVSGSTPPFGGGAPAGDMWGAIRK